MPFMTLEYPRNEMVSTNMCRSSPVMHARANKNGLGHVDVHVGEAIARTSQEGRGTRDDPKPSTNDLTKAASSLRICLWGMEVSWTLIVQVSIFKNP